MFPLDVSVFFQPWAKKILCITYVAKIVMTETKKYSMTEECTNRSVEQNRKARNSGTNTWDLVFGVSNLSDQPWKDQLFRERCWSKWLTILWWWLREVDNRSLPLTVIKTQSKKRDKYKKQNYGKYYKNIQEYFVTQESLHYIMPSKEYYKIIHTI